MRIKLVALGFAALALSSASAQSDVNSQTVKDALQEFSAGGSQKSGVEFHQKDATVGSPYVSKEWLKGSVVNYNDTVINSPGLLYNYNKMTGALLVTQDQNNYIELNRNSYKSFTLTDALGVEHRYVYVPTISPTASVEVVAAGPNYSIYKLTKTRFKKADYITDGLTERGNNYDEYVDEYEYYVVNSKDKNMQANKIGTKKKALKDAFGADAAKVDAYVAQHKADLNAEYFKGLGDYLNQ